MPAGNVEQVKRLEKGKPVEKQGHKVTGLSGRFFRMIAGLPEQLIELSQAP